MATSGRRVTWRAFARQMSKNWSEDSLSDTAAALTYWGVLSLFPFLLFLVALASLVLSPGDVRGLVDSLGRVAPGPATQVLAERLDSLLRNPSGGLLTVGILGALWSASSAVASLMQALNRCYDVRETRSYLKSRAIAMLATIAVGVLSVIAAVILFAVPALGAWIGGTLGRAIGWLRYPVAGAIVMTMWAFLYWALPNVRPKFQLVTPGSAAGVLLWLLASWGLSQYASHFGSYEATYGAVGGVILLLVWMWISSLVVLLGAEINKVLTPDVSLKHSATGEARAGGTKEQPVTAGPKTGKEWQAPGAGHDEPSPA